MRRRTDARPTACTYADTNNNHPRIGNHSGPPPEAADVLLNPTPIEGGRYVRGRTVAIDILPKKGWQVDRWAGPVYDEVGVSAKIDMNSSHTVIVRLVRVIAVPPTAAPSTLAPSAAVRATAMPPASVPPTRTYGPPLPRRPP
jgi:hypothetical protein